MKFKDGFVQIMADMVPTQLGFAPNEPFEVSASGWFDAYNAVEKYSQAHESVEDDARAVFDAVVAGDMDDDYETLDDVERDGIMRARVFEDGTVHLFDTNMDAHVAQHGDAPNIQEGEDPTDVMSMARICDDFGVTPFFPKADFEAGEQKCQVRFHLIDEAEFRESFMDEDPEGDIETADLKGFFQPATSEDLGGTLRSIDIAKGDMDVRGEQTWTATLTVDVTNPDLLLMKAAAAGRETGRDGDYVPENVGDAIFESWFGSNDTGSPVDFGLEIIDWGPEAAPEQEPEDNGPGF
ncbi:MAG: hypothetical protein ABJN42_21800 [Roseibium sp.]|uniref:hypothetical protein n=1 Tax=Roseibium sp. TaxID=1936156 RepID=UPI0032996B41